MRRPPCSVPRLVAVPAVRSAPSARLSRAVLATGALALCAAFPAVGAQAPAGAAVPGGAASVGPGAGAGVVAARSAAPLVTPPRDVMRMQLAPGRAHPLSFDAPVLRVSVTNTEVADVLVLSERDVVVNAKAAGETDVLLWTTTGRRHLRITVAAPSDRAQIVLAVKIAEVRRDALRAVGTSLAHLHARRTQQANSGVFSQPGALDSIGAGRVQLTGEPRFLNVLTDFGTRDLLAFVEAEQQRGNARALAEPTLMTANREEASFLVGGEVPIPIAQPGPNGQAFVTIVFREFGVRLAFTPEILSDSIVKLKIRPEVSSLDYSNAVTLSGFRIPALRTRRLESTMDVRRDQSLVISGLFNDERTRVRTGVPWLMDVPVLGRLFSSTTWQQNESELLVIVTPTVVMPDDPRPQDVVPLVPDPRRPADEALAPRLAPPASTAPSPDPAVPPSVRRP